MTTFKTIEETFSERTIYSFSDKEIDPEIIKSIYKIAALGPTSSNCSPLRILFVKSQEQKKHLIQCVDKGNVEKILSAPITAIFAYDTEFYNKLDYLVPFSNRSVKSYFQSMGKEEFQDTIIRNSTLQAAYFIVVAKYFGLGCGPLSGFDHSKLDESFFKNSKYRVNFLCNLGYQKTFDTSRDRLPRLSFEDSCKFI